MQAAATMPIERRAVEKREAVRPGATGAKAHFAHFLVQEGLVTRQQLSVLPAEGWRSATSLGKMALSHGLLDYLEIVRILDRQEQTKEAFGQIAVQQRYLTHPQLMTLVAGQSLRACLELVEDLVFAGHLQMHSSLKALLSYLSDDRNLQAICLEGLAQEGA